MKKLPTVTIAASAYNEGENIKNFLESLINQKQEDFILEKILVISDGSTDKTVSASRYIKNSKVEVREYKERAGKSTRLNEIYQYLKSDVLIQTDCDVIFEGPYVMRDMVRALTKNAKVGMCGGNSIPLKATTFVEKAVNYTHGMYVNFRHKVRGKNNMFSVDGRILGFRKELVKKIKVPTDMITNDLYTYFCCIAYGYGYRFVDTAIIRFRSPRSLADHIEQNTRYLAAKQRMKRYFDAGLVNREFHIPRAVLIKGMFFQFVKNPILCVFIFFINKYCSIRASVIENNLDAKWAIASTTKKVITE